MSATQPKPSARFPAWAGDALGALVVVVTSLVPGPGMGMGGALSGMFSGDGSPGSGGPHPGGPTDAPALPFDALPFVVMLASIALIPFRRRWPIPVFVTSLALYCATVLMHSPATGVGIVAVLAAYSLGSSTTRRATLIWGGMATLVVAVLSVTVANFGVVDPRVFQIAAGVAVAAALGDSSRSHREFLVAATERAERAEKTREAEVQAREALVHRRVAEERLRIAQDLHDTVAHQISVISLNAGAASGSLAALPAEQTTKARDSLATIRTSARLVLTEIGTLLRYLRTDGPSHEASPEAPLPSVADFDSLYASVRAAGLRLDVSTSGDLARVTPVAGAAAYRIAQEALTNALKHGASRQAAISVSIDGDALVVTVTNPVASPVAVGDGPGAANQADPYRGGLGLTGIRERVAAVGGSVTVTPPASLPGNFTVAARLPLGDPGDSANTTPHRGDA